MRRAGPVWIAVVLFAAAAGFSAAAADVPAYKLHGLNFSPYVDGQSPEFGSVVTLSQVQARLALVAPYTSWVRSFSSTNGHEHIPPAAKALGLRVAAGAWIGPDAAINAQEIDALIANVLAGHVDIAIVGSEALLRGDVTPAQLIAYINQVQQVAPAGVLVATADTFDRLLRHPDVIAAGDVVLPNIYPYWMRVSRADAICVVDTAYAEMVAASGGRPVVISEVGWPSDGTSDDGAVPSEENASAFFRDVVSWARTRVIPYFYFSALDETWKTESGGVGPHWGIFDTNGVLKPGFQTAFDNPTATITCSSTPTLTLTYVPPYASTSPNDVLQGTVRGVLPSAHRVIVYIFVPGFGWVVKPTSSTPYSAIDVTGAWSADLVTGGSDQLATQVAAFLIPNAYAPPEVVGLPALPAEIASHALASALITRSVNSISGRVTTPLGTAVAGLTITLSGTNTSTTTTARDGRYAFVNLTGAGADVVTPVSPNRLFTPAAHSIANVSGRVIADFVGTRVTPTVTTLAPINVAASSATLRGTVNPNGIETVARFDYGHTASYGRQVTVAPSLGAGAAAVAVGADISGLACGTVYHARAVGLNGAATPGGDVTFTTTTCPAFTDASLGTGTHLIRAVHILELRSRIDAVRIRRGLAPFAWTDPDLAPQIAVLKAAHIADLRLALVEAYHAAPAVPAPTFTDPVLTAGVTGIRAVHILELRAAVIAIE